jgi:hypothetical protein
MVCDVLRTTMRNQTQKKERVFTFPRRSLVRP